MWRVHKIYSIKNFRKLKNTEILKYRLKGFESLNDWENLWKKKNWISKYFKNTNYLRTWRIRKIKETSIIPKNFQNLKKMCEAEEYKISNKWEINLKSRNFKYAIIFANTKRLKSKECEFV